MNKKTFASSPSLYVAPDATNNAGAPAYAMEPEEALAQLAVTGFFGDTFYVSAETQLAQILELAAKCDDAFVAQVARYARGAGFMKDTPAVLLAYLFGKKSGAFTAALFDEVINNAKMLSNFVQAVRSGRFGRRSLGSVGKRLVSNWLNRANVDYLWKQSIAKDPSLGDIIKLARPRPVSKDMDTLGFTLDRERATLYRMLIGKPVENPEALPQLVQDTLAFRADQTKPLPDVPFNMIDTVPLTTAHWEQLFDRGGFQFTRMNLVTAQRHGVFKSNPELLKKIVARLSSKEEVLKAKQFPYQLLQAFSMVAKDADMPHELKYALGQALDHSLAAVPALEGNVYVAVDCSGSMKNPVTGYRGNASTEITYMDVAALFAAAIVRRSPQTRVMTFANNAVIVPLNPLDSIPTMAQKLANAGGGTDCSAPMRLLASEKRDVDTFILISDNESWLDSSGMSFTYNYATHTRDRAPGTVAAWDDIKRKNPNAKQVRINISPNATDQLPKRKDTLRVAGFSDAVFTSVAAWLQNKDWPSCIREFGR
jgi:60 kDa SS-A/Ro ribonucleoprotein